MTTAHTPRPVPDRAGSDAPASVAAAGLATISRRRLLGLMSAAGGAVLLGCAGGDDAVDGATASSTASTGSTASSAASPSTSAAAASTTTAASVAGTAATAAPPTTAATTTAAAETTCAVVPSETGGPFPADGTNQNGSGALADVLADGRSVRQDIRGDLDGSNVQDGVPMTLRVRVVDTASSCKAVAGAAVYVWHCNKDGVYSAYNSPMNGGDESARSYLRGVQVTDANGDVTFRTILPGRYQGRAFHIHFEVYRGAEPTGSAKVLTSQMAADDAFIDQLYASVGYSAAARNVTHNGEDNVFSDGVERQLLTISGDATGVTASIVVGL